MQCLSRYLEYQQFEKKLEACLSSTAVKTKFAAHTARGKDIVVRESAGCREQPIFGRTTSCRIMNNFSEYATCPHSGSKKYLPLIQSQHLPAGHRMKDRVLLDDNFPNKYISFNATEFPSFCGKSATFTMWIENWACSRGETCLVRVEVTVKCGSHECAYADNSNLRVNMKKCQVRRGRK